jgi:hypothetical protein
VTSSEGDPRSRLVLMLLARGKTLSIPAVERHFYAYFCILSLLLVPYLVFVVTNTPSVACSFDFLSFTLNMHSWVTFYQPSFSSLNLWKMYRAK